MNDPDSTTVTRIVAEMRRARRLLFITGAGISADSGLPTYRGIGGLYNDQATEENFSIETALSGSMLEANPAITWKYLHQIENSCRGARFNDAHAIIAEWQDRIADRIAAEPMPAAFAGLPPAALAGFIVAAYSGAMTMAKAEQSSAQLDSTVAILARLLALPAA